MSARKCQAPFALTVFVIASRLRRGGPGAVSTVLVAPGSPWRCAPRDDSVLTEGSEQLAIGIRLTLRVWLAAPGIQDDSQIQEPGGGRHIGDVGQPRAKRVLRPSWFGPDAVKSRSTRSGAGRASLSRAVVVGRPWRWQAPTRPPSRIKRAMRLRLCFSPRARSSAWTRGDPYVCRELAWTVRTRFSSAASATAWADGGRCSQA